MSVVIPPVSHQTVVYPESDGMPMADNTLQFEYISTIKWGLEALFREERVFVAGDLFWYPVEGNPGIRAAPDTMVVFGRPKGHRGSYLQWLEENIAPQVVFEILSPNNRVPEMTRKFDFYQRYGVEEYYLFDPDTGDLCGWLRQGDHLEVIPKMAGWISPRLQVRFELVNAELFLRRPDGRRFGTYMELIEQAEIERSRAEAERSRAEAERTRAEAERTRAEKLAAQLRALGINPDA